MKFEEWKKEKGGIAAKFHQESSLKMGWDAALEYGSEKTSTNKQMDAIALLEEAKIALVATGHGGFNVSLIKDIDAVIALQHH